jgi:membrane protease YdiL (CAAX protease family)
MPRHITLQVDIGITRAAYQAARSRARRSMTEAPFTDDAEDMTNTQSLPAKVDVPASSKQYSLIKILAIWASVTIPMGLLAWVVAPAIIPHTSLHPGLVHWTLMVVGMMWQFVVSLAVLGRELGGLHWSSIKERIWLNLPRDPHTGKARKVLFLWAIPAIAANVLGGFLAIPLDKAWTNWLPGLDEPSYAHIGVLADPQFQGQWWILGLALTSMLFNYILGEELLFRGVLLPRMAGVFGRWDWIANTVLFGLYHVHKIWAWPSMITTSFGYAWATKRYRSFWMGVIVHGIEGYFIVLVVGVLAGWYPVT